MLKRLPLLLIGLLLTSLFSSAFSSTVKAAEWTPCSILSGPPSYSDKGYFTHTDMEIVLNFNWDKTDPNWEYFIMIDDHGIPAATRRTDRRKITQNTLRQSFVIPGGIDRNAKYNVYLKHNEGNLQVNESPDLCGGALGQITVFSKEFGQIDENACKIEMPDNVEFEKPFPLSITTKKIDNLVYSFKILDRQFASTLKYGIPYDQFHSIPSDKQILNYLLKVNSLSFTYKNDDSIENAPDKTASTTIIHKKLNLGNYTAVLMAQNPGSAGYRVYCAKKDFDVTKIPVSSPTSGIGIPAPGASGNPLTAAGSPVIRQQCTPDDLRAGKCTSSAGKYCNPGDKTPTDDPDAKGVYTSIGCIPTDPLLLIQSLIKFSTFGAGGIALILMIVGSLRMIMSAGNADNLKNGRDQFISAVIGLLFIIFAILLLQIIGVDLLDIPGFPD